MAAVFLSRRRFLSACTGLTALTALTACSGKDQLLSPLATPSTSPVLRARQTPFGAVQGKVEGGVETYFNVPYGKSPTGSLRWQPPEDPDVWHDTLDCSQSRFQALQMHKDPQAGPDVQPQLVGSADCLRLDIYTSAQADKWPVMVYLHGGNNQTGSALEIPGTEIVERTQAVYVSVDYRLGLLGFNALPALQQQEGSSGNYALLDIAHALRWVRNNIASFGGDPGNITLSGFSAGGRDVMAALVSPALSGLFDRAIAFSGGLTIADEEESARVIAAAVAPLAVQDGLATDEAQATEWLLQPSVEVRDYLYGLPDERLVALMGNAGIRMSVFPHLYADAVTLPREGFASKQWVNDVPLMMLTGETEFSFFAMGSPVYDELGELGDAARSFAIEYGSELYRIFNTQSSAARMAGTYESELFLVQVNYGGKDSASGITPLGSFHGIFAPMLGCHNYDGLYDFSEPGYRAMADVFNGYLRNFLHGDPLSESMEVTWSPWTTDSKDTLVLDAKDGRAEVSVMDVYREPQQVIEQLRTDSSLPEDAKERVVKEVLNGRWFSTELDAAYGSVQAVHLK